jgi:adenylate cyclase class IV
VKLSFEKRRETWEIGDCEVVLDELPEGLGKFVEIEGHNEGCIQKVRHDLSLENASVEAEGYAVLVDAHLRKTGRTRLTFSD